MSSHDERVWENTRLKFDNGLPDENLQCSRIDSAGSEAGQIRKAEVDHGASDVGIAIGKVFLGHVGGVEQPTDISEHTFAQALNRKHPAIAPFLQLSRLFIGQ